MLCNPGASLKYAHPYCPAISKHLGKEGMYKSCSQRHGEGYVKIMAYGCGALRCDFPWIKPLIHAGKILSVCPKHKQVDNDPHH